MLLWSVLSLPILLILSAYFSSVETAFTSLTPGQINSLAENRGKRGLLVKKLTERHDILLTTLLIGNNLANLGASALTTAMTIRLFGKIYVAAATGVLTLTVLVFCEVSPKQIALVANETLCLISARLINLLSIVLRPFIWIVSSVSRGITLLFVGSKRREITLEQLLHHVKVAEGQGVVESYEEEMVRNVFRINDTPVKAIMTHRTELFMMNENTTVQDAAYLFVDSGHTRAPVLNGDLEHVSGIVTLFDLVRALRKRPRASIKTISKSPYLVPGTMKAHELYFRLRSEPIQMAIVLDEYGGLDGIVTREDIIEEIFGKFLDERANPSANPISEQPDGSWIIQGDTDFYDLSDILGLELKHDSRTNTIGGYLLEKSGNIPVQGTVIELGEGQYTILRTRNKRIVSVRFKPIDND
ncbi:Magnesium and cobalt efflux protein CorC [Olavius algarvensis spirochete endosymbiont]|uniref:hemolysin family protein n=1 Tax=Olavius algarvensis spirochete endosymbiont TaxID=260710 RepID=UPI00052B89E3|nr:hemolysin family protein [Olavius algarvensis spirochete endosymbiont]KGM43238.1 hypothetical protein JY97_08415 [Alkalispirochaeta odontotermitis]VDB00040.1 Magnesium and cobalt efflux protein CorC [Olavius algarvensis spirochete endosymbiont]